MNLRLIEKYAKGLIDSVGIDSINEYIVALQNVSMCFDNERFVNIISSPLVQRDQKQELVLSIVNINSDKFSNFIKLLSRNNRLNLIPNLYAYLNQYIDVVNGKYKLIIYSSFMLSDDEMEIITSSISKKTGVSLHPVQKSTNEEGIRIFIDSLFIEISFIRNQFNKSIKDHLLKPFK